jgi:hypothetical protein
MRLRLKKRLYVLSVLSGSKGRDTDLDRKICELGEAWLGACDQEEGELYGRLRDASLVKKYGPDIINDDTGMPVE